ncbi:MAG: hypothetical protein KJ548_11580 [Actinobacteria bacterium]|nr:hypothetical protein [Actinomycetota bacterium]MCG2797462.1 hypothetical protein [Cellulomonas sp.]
MNDVDDDSQPPLVPAGIALQGLEIEPLPDGSAVRGLFAFVKMDDSDGDIAWSVRVTDGLNDEEVLGVLVGYLEHLKIKAADSWEDS